MSDGSNANRTASRLALACLAAVVYFVTPSVSRPVAPVYDHFPRLARAFLMGQLSIDVAEESRGPVEELIPSAAPGQFFCAYPPLPAILLMPFVALFGSAVTTTAACRAISILNVLLFDACLERLPKRLHLASLAPSARWLFNLLFAFGTVTWHNTHMGGDWHLAHAVTLAAELLAMYEFLGRNRPAVIGGCVGMIVLTRPTAALACLFVVLPMVRATEGQKLANFLAAPVVAAILLGLYNAGRFGNPIDFGYDRMILTGSGKVLMDTYGQFSFHYIPRNFFWFFLAPPWGPSVHGLPIGSDPRGMSLFFACPAMAYALVALKRNKSLPLVRDAGLSIALTLVPLLMYFNTGFWQFGHRFSMDYLAVLMLLVVVGMGARPTRWGIALCAASIIIQFVGVVLQPIARLPNWLTI